MADHLRSVIDTLSPEDQAEVAGQMLCNILGPEIPPGPPYVPDSLQLLDPVALAATLDEMGLPRA